MGKKRTKQGTMNTTTKNNTGAEFAAAADAKDAAAAAASAAKVLRSSLAIDRPRTEGSRR